MQTTHLKKIAALYSIFILSLMSNPLSACEVTPPFATEAEAAAHVASKKPVTCGMIMYTIHSDNLAVLKILMQNYPFSLDSYPIGPVSTPMSDAIDKNATKVIHYLINEKGIKPDSSHVHWALNGFRAESLKALLQYPVDINGKNWHDQTAIQAAQSTGYEFGITLLKEFEAKTANK